MKKINIMTFRFISIERAVSLMPCEIAHKKTITYSYLSPIEDARHHSAYKSKVSLRNFLSQFTSLSISRMVLLPLLLIPCLKAEAQTLALKTNMLALATTSLNIGGETTLNDTYTALLNVGYNPWTFSDNKKLKHVLIQPELRKWFWMPFWGPFIGVEAHYAAFNVGGVTPLTTLKNNRYQGSMIGGGITCGYQWMLSTSFDIEAYLGLGYSHIDYKKYGPEKGAVRTDKSDYNYFGPTEIGISLVYMIK